MENVDYDLIIIGGGAGGAYGGDFRIPLYGKNLTG
jgi:hypothetical protein